MRHRRWQALLVLIAAWLALVAVAPIAAQQSTTAVHHGINLADMDLSVDPDANFYRFANGGWLDRTTIPQDEGAYGVFNELDDLTREQLLTLMADLADGGDLQEGSDAWKAVGLYAQGMDIATRNAQGVDPIRPLLDRIDGIADLDGFHRFQQTAEFSWLTGLFYTFVIPDLTDSSVYAAYLSGPFLGLPNRDYYLEDDAANLEVREAYVAVCAELLGYVGYDAAAARTAAQAVYDLERAFAAVTLTREEQQDFSLYNNPLTLAELAQHYPLMDWDAYVAELGLTGVERLTVTELRYLDALEGIVRGAPLSALKDYVKLEVMWSFADFLGEDVGETAFAFRGGVLGGAEEQRPLAERTLDQVSGMLGEAIGR
ncbi:MAG: putative endopeptidase, partial [Thermomicrobiales bacterium]|nr:putative endopeptidase [Thermomicrobiales bacterium]